MEVIESAKEREREREGEEAKAKANDGGQTRVKKSNLSARKRERDEGYSVRGGGTKGFTTNLAIEADLIWCKMNFLR